MAQQIPCWLYPRQQAVATALVKAGYRYFGLADSDNFSYKHSIKRGDWRIAPALYEPCLDLECNGALFTKELLDDERDGTPDFEIEITWAKELIIRNERAFDRDNQSQYQQLCLF